MIKKHLTKIASGKLYTDLDEEGVLNKDYFKMLHWVGRNDCVHIYDEERNLHEVYLQISII